jgi:hypothetical protein
LVNSLIDGTIHQDKLIEFKQQHKIVADTDEELGTVGVRWYEGFMNRNKKIAEKIKGFHT